MAERISPFFTSDCRLPEGCSQALIECTCTGFAQSREAARRIACRRRLIAMLAECQVGISRIIDDSDMLHDLHFQLDEMIADVAVRIERIDEEMREHEQSGGASLADERRARQLENF